jgi:hypothetical protein
MVSLDSRYHDSFLIIFTEKTPTYLQLGKLEIGKLKVGKKHQIVPLAWVEN